MVAVSRFWTAPHGCAAGLDAGEPNTSRHLRAVSSWVRSCTAANDLTPLTACDDRSKELRPWADSEARSYPPHNPSLKTLGGNARRESRISRRILIPLLAVALIAGTAGKASSDNYGGVSRAVKARMVALVHRTFDRYGVSGVMLCIVNRESGFNPKAANWHDSNGGSFGLWQVNGIWRQRGENTQHFATRMFNPYTNARYALALYRSSGLSPWGGGCG